MEEARRGSRTFTERLAEAVRPAGLHVLLRLPHGTDDIAVRDAAHDAGIRCASLSQFAVSRTDLAGLVIGYGRIHEDAIDRAIAKLASVVRRARVG